MTSADLADDLQAQEGLTPALRLLAVTIDRAFERRELSKPTVHEFAAHHVGAEVDELVVCSQQIALSVAHSVGRWMFVTQHATNAPYMGGAAGQLPTTVVLKGAHREVRAMSSATLALRPGLLGASACVLRLVSDSYHDEVQLIGHRSDDDELARSLTTFLRARCSADSPYRGGSYRVTATNRGLLLKEWMLPSASRDLLKLAPSVWEPIDRSVHRVLDLADDLSARGLGTSAGVLLVGPPGTGKTQLGTVVANELRGSATVLLPENGVVKHWLTELFELAADLSPCLVLMDDLDLIAGERGTADPDRLREFLNVMDGGLADRSGVVVIASTNDHRKVDKAARRSSRFDTVIMMEAPSADARLSILRRYLAWCDAVIDFDAVVRATDGATGADLKDLVRATVLQTADDVTTSALLTQAATGRWRSGAQPVGDYL
jgi:hypothetical protein